MIQNINIQTIKQRLLITLSVIMFLLFVPVAVLAQAEPAPDADTSASGSSSAVANPSKDAACEGIEAAGGDCDSGSAQPTFENIVTNIIDILSIVVGAVCVIMVIIGGFRYVISAGDSNGVQGAKNTILYALVGLVVVIFARTIVVFVISNL